MKKAILSGLVISVAICLIVISFDRCESKDKEINETVIDTANTSDPMYKTADSLLNVINHK